MKYSILNVKQSVFKRITIFTSFLGDVITSNQTDDLINIDFDMKEDYDKFLILKNMID